MVKIAHFADVHIRNIERHEEYISIFEKIYNKLKEIKPDRIVIAGDLFESYIEISNEAKIIAGDFLNNLSNISKVIITRGNHDIRKKNTNRIDSVKTIIKLIKNKNIFYYDTTGFYDDEFDITWVVYDHIDKDNNPWKNNVKDSSRIYVGIYHDPIQNSSSDIGKIFSDSKYKDISYFKNNDYLLLGDIHKRQFFRKNKSSAYPGSTIQQHFGENVEGHGFLLWNIESSTKFKVEEFDIQNEHIYLNFNLDENTDYDNLKLKTNYSGDDLEIKIHWKEYSSNINIINEKKIRDYIKNNFNTTKVVFDKTHIYNDVISSKMISESLDLTDIDVQNKILIEYLKEQKYNDDDINEIAKIDNIINDRLHLSDNKTNIEWSIDKFWFSNFKSYGDDNIIDWRDTDGIYQIHGLNQQGKTTILDAITYILFGKTTTTLNRQEFGDNRYINNKRNLDYSLGGAVIDVNGEKFVIQRKTERKWNRQRTALTSCSTNLDFYKSDKISEENKLTGELRTKTQKLLDSILGDFSDFIRLSLTNADNLNSILSENRSDFIDNIIRDAGYDIFETKLSEFKEYKKELNEDKININLEQSKLKIENLNNEIFDIKEKIEDKNKYIKELEEDLSLLNRDRDNLNKKIFEIDSSMLNFDEEYNLYLIKKYEDSIVEYKNEINKLKEKINLLPSSFDNNIILDLKSKLKKENDNINEKKDFLNELKRKLVDYETKKDKLFSEVKILKENEVKNIELRISENNLNVEKIKNQRENIILEELKIIDKKLQKIEIEKNDINNNIKTFKKDASTLKNINDELELEIDNLKKSTSCPTCGKKYDKNIPEDIEHLEHLENKINILLKKKEDNDILIQELFSEFKKIKNVLPDLEKEEEELRKNKSDIKNNEFSDELKNKIKNVGNVKSLKIEIDDLKNEIQNIKNDIFDNSKELFNKISNINENIKDIELKKEDIKINIFKVEKELLSFNIKSIENEIEEQEDIRNNYEIRKQSISKVDNINLSIENTSFKIKDIDSKIKDYQEYKDKINKNKEIEIEIKNIDINILEKKESIKNILTDIKEIEKIELLNKSEIKNINNNIKIYLKQKKTEELLKEYQKCISRDGIPSYLLKKSIHLINRELSDLLSNMNFSLFFDENLILRMSADDRLDVSQNVIEGSGMERTFCALALKIALREINVKSKTTFIVLDEIMGKLVDSSVQNFIDFLDVLKTKVKKILIIEHVHPINYDVLITVNKDKDLISSLSIE